MIAELSALAVVAGANFFFIGLKSFQQRNVAFDNFGWIMPTSAAMAVVEVYVIATVAHYGFHWAMVGALALGGGTGSMAATYLHGKHIKKGTVAA